MQKIVPNFKIGVLGLFCCDISGLHASPLSEETVVTHAKITGCKYHDPTVIMMGRRWLLAVQVRTFPIPEEFEEVVRHPCLGRLVELANLEDVQVFSRVNDREDPVRQRWTPNINTATKVRRDASVPKPGGSRASSSHSKL